jgi:hypothetical protein
MDLYSSEKNNINMVIDFKTPREYNTTPEYSQTLWRVFIGDKLFVSNDGITVWDNFDKALSAFISSRYYNTITNYVNECARYFAKDDDIEWKIDFIQRIANRIELQIIEYKPDV